MEKCTLTHSGPTLTLRVSYVKWVRVTLADRYKKRDRPTLCIVQISVMPFLSQRIQPCENYKYLYLMVDIIITLYISCGDGHA